MKNDKKKQPTAKQTVFIKEYLVDLNATQAAIRAGYSKRRACEIGYQLLHKPTVSLEIAKTQAERLSKLDISADKIVSELAKVAFFDVTRVVRINNGRVVILDTDEMPENDRKSLVEISESETASGQVSKKIKAHDKLKALELLGRHLAMFTDRIETPGAPEAIVLNHYGPIPKKMQKQIEQAQNDEA